MWNYSCSFGHACTSFPLDSQSLMFLSLKSPLCILLHVYDALGLSHSTTVIKFIECFPANKNWIVIHPKRLQFRFFRTNTRNKYTHLQKQFWIVRRSWKWNSCDLMYEILAVSSKSDCNFLTYSNWSYKIKYANSAAFILNQSVDNPIKW